MKSYLKNNLTRKLFLLLCSALVAVSLMLCGLFAVLMPQSLKAVQGERFTEEVNTLIAKIQKSDFQTADSLLGRFALQNKVVLYLTTADGQYISAYTYESAVFDNAGMNFHGSNSDSSSQNGTFSRIDGDNQTNISLANEEKHTVQIENQKYIVSIFGAGTETVNEVVIVLQKTIPWILLTVCVIALALSSFLSKFITTPIKQIGKAAEQMAALNFDVHCGGNRTDELGQLSQNINTLAKTLDTTLKELSHELEVEKVLEENQRLFFASASHELKTPLTIMKNKLEGMIYGYGEYKDRDVFLASTLRTAAEMERLINEILSVSQLNNKSVALKKETVCLKEIIGNIIDDYTDLIEMKQYLIDISLDNTEVVADKKLLTKAIQNIIGNAVSYSPDGAKVTITLSGNTLWVENYGISLPRADIVKLCEPFYRVDLSRNRRTGGSGLGLHFVKTILEQHGFSFEITSEIDSVLVKIHF